MRISDWSSDVCSSDLIDAAEKDLRTVIANQPNDARSLNALGYMLAVHTQRLDEAHDLVGKALSLDPDDASIIDSMGRSEEHTSELQSLMRISYAVFCLKKKNTMIRHNC